MNWETIAKAVGLTKGTFGPAAKRAVIEFTLPVIVGALWLYANWKPDASRADLVAHFAAAMFFTSWLVGNWLRIVHQETQRQHQSTVLTEVRWITAAFEKSLQPILARLPRDEAETVGEMIHQANNQIDSVVTRHFTMKAEGGTFHIGGTDTGVEYRIIPDEKK